MTTIFLAAFCGAMLGFAAGAFCSGRACSARVKYLFGPAAKTRFDSMEGLE